MGRGCRSLNDYAEGTIICDNPLTLDGGEYKDELLIHDGEIAESLDINCKIARMLHNQTFKKSVTPEQAQKLKEEGKPIPDPND